MNHSPYCIGIEALKRKEQLIRDRLANEPGDMEARTNLAWCLLMMAVYQAGQENVLGKLMLARHGIKAKTSRKLWSALDQGSHDTLKDCLRQTYIVTQLSADPRACTDVARLQALVKLMGAEELVSEAEQEAARILEELTQGILFGPEEDGELIEE